VPSPGKGRNLSFRFHSLGKSQLPPGRKKGKAEFQQATCIFRAERKTYIKGRFSISCQGVQQLVERGGNRDELRWGEGLTTDVSKKWKKETADLLAYKRGGGRCLTCDRRDITSVPERRGGEETTGGVVQIAGEGEGFHFRRKRELLLRAREKKDPKYLRGTGVVP